MGDVLTLTRALERVGKRRDRRVRRKTSEGARERERGWKRRRRAVDTSRRTTVTQNEVYGEAERRDERGRAVKGSGGEVRDGAPLLQGLLAV